MNVRLIVKHRNASAIILIIFWPIFLRLNVYVIQNEIDAVSHVIPMISKR